ncbi:sensor histidine kinase [Paucibacter sp. Y2R2-4]|uniref:sensor histidine kinase n=1 Tax=Paucibacter sp. Y2R2-4 TaxID=2893553 RepID=UPI0021E389D5|nr:histidine kinase [Paucibacter sp. Y2R2-4]MCV2351365.1 histidine kinase [Paucibacter sp. Y2R2-4]
MRCSSTPPAEKDPQKLKLDWSQWVWPGPRRIFSADEMARAGDQPWPDSIDHYVYSNVVVLLAINYNMLSRGLIIWVLFAALGMSYGALWVAKALWRQPTRTRLNLYTIGCVVLMLGTLLLLKFQPFGLGPKLDQSEMKGVMLAFVAAVVLAMTSWFFLVLIRVQQIESRLRELDERDQHLKLARRLATAQIQPHFLFNTLASVQHWVDTQDPRAGSTLRSFTQYLRATLPMFERESLSLQEELQIVRSYLEVMQARMGARLQWQIELAPEVDASLPLPPGLLLTLVENAIGHGIEPALRGGSIGVRASRPAQGQVLIEVSDDGIGLSAQAQDGTGLANSRARLQQLYGERARLSLTALTPGCLSQLHIETEGTQA